MSDVFISYSRRDIDFFCYLFDQLKACDRDAWADWQDIPPTADWLAEIYRGFVISPDSVASEICTLEIEHAVKHHKRLAPVVWKGWMRNEGVIGSMPSLARTNRNEGKSAHSAQ